MQTEYKQKFVREYRLKISRLLSVLDEMRGTQAEYTSQDFGNKVQIPDTKAEVVVEDPIFQTGEHAGITRDEFMAGVASVDALLKLIGEGHGTNLYKLRYFGT